jgi:hypothetical protein
MSRRGGGLSANASGVEPHRASISSRFGLQVCGGGCARTRARHVPRYVMSTVFRVAGRGGGEVGGWGGGGNCRAPPTRGGGRGRARSLSGHVCAPPDGFGCPGAQLHRRALLSRLRACEGRGLPVDLPVRFFFLFSCFRSGAPRVALRCWLGWSPCAKLPVSCHERWNAHRHYNTQQQTTAPPGCHTSALSSSATSSTSRPTVAVSCRATTSTSTPAPS